MGFYHNSLDGAIPGGILAGCRLLMSVREMGA
jgi:hypothetical protein